MAKLLLFGVRNKWTGSLTGSMVSRLRVPQQAKDGQEINLWSVEFKSKGRGFRACNDDNLMIAAGGSTMQPFCTANAQLWQRQIRLVFACLDSEARRDLNFPRGSNRFYARDHAKITGDKYVVRIKESDC